MGPVLKAVITRIISVMHTHKSQTFALTIVKFIAGHEGFIVEQLLFCQWADVRKQEAGCRHGDHNRLIRIIFFLF